MEEQKKRGGFAAMDPDARREAGRRGGKRAHELGVAHRFTPEEARRAGKIGGPARAAQRRAESAPPSSAAGGAT